ncbi:MAG: hypothetical protein ACRD5K_17315 [Candidatus Acidiferrales bacterium]
MSLDKGGKNVIDRLGIPGPHEIPGRPKLRQPPIPSPSFSRRRFLESAAGAAVLGSGLVLPSIGRAAGHMVGDERSTHDFPQPIPTGISPFGGPLIHIYPPGAASENSSIWDFDGFVGVAQGNVNGEGLLGGVPQKFAGANNNCDMRFMSGIYEGLDGKIRQGSFALI